VQCTVIYLALVYDIGWSDPVIPSIIVALEIYTHNIRLTLFGVVLLDLVRIVSVWFSSLTEVPTILGIYIIYETYVR
jgi:hypothetical protein